MAEGRASVAIIYVKIIPSTRSKYRKYAIKSHVYKLGQEEVVNMGSYVCRESHKMFLVYRIGHLQEVIVPNRSPEVRTYSRKISN